MDKKWLFIGLGVVALGGIAFFVFRKPSSENVSNAQLPDSGSLENSTDSSLGDIDGLLPTASRKQVRRDCRAEAKAKGLKGKEKRQFKRDCKAAGGVNADFVSEQAGFAFNGYGGDIENIGF